MGCQHYCISAYLGINDQAVINGQDNRQKSSVCMISHLAAASNICTV